MIQILKLLTAVLLATLLMACGGGGGSAGTVANSGSTSAGSTATAAVTDFAMFTDKASITNSGTDTALVTVVALDANRNIVPGAKVQVVTDQNSVFTPSGAPSTDDTGSYSGRISFGADKSNRVITIVVTVNGIVKSTSIRVVGSKLTLAASPSTPSPNQAVNLSATLVDVSGNPIIGAPIVLSGNITALQNQTIVTGADGVATKAFNAPVNSGAYTISASGGGVAAGDYQLQVFTSAVPAAIIPAGAVPSMSASPNVLAVNSAGSTTNRSNVRVLFLDSANRPVQNVRVRFSDLTTGLPAVGASISSGTQTLYTDAGGSVSTQYIAGQNTSPTNGVSLRACYSATDFVSSTDCPAFVSVSLTVAGQALAVSIGDDNLLTKGSGTYVKNFVITVADSAGRAMANAPVDISVDLTHYGKGAFSYSSGSVTSAYFDANGNAVSSLSVVPQSLTGFYPSDTAVPGSTLTGRVWCANEDTNRNGNVDSGENINTSVDTNGQATLEPRKSDLIVSYANPAITTTDASGILLIKVEYSQRFATWLAYRVRVTANVAGSQGLAERLFVTSFIAGDDVNGSFLQGPYGFGSCRSPN